MKKKRGKRVQKGDPESVARQETKERKRMATLEVHKEEINEYSSKLGIKINLETCSEKEFNAFLKILLSNEKEENPLHVALMILVIYSRLDLLQALKDLFEGVNITVVDVIRTAIYGNLGVFQWIVDFAHSNCRTGISSKVWYECLRYAVAHGHLEIAEWILSYYPSVVVDDFIIKCSIKDTDRHLKIFSSLLDHGYVSLDINGIIEHIEFMIRSMRRGLFLDVCNMHIKK